MIIIFTKEEFLSGFCIGKLFTKEEFNEKIESYKRVLILKEEYPTYDEYVEFYAKKGFDFYKYYSEQTKQLGEFQKWLKDNKNKAFTYDEINQKLLELKLSFDGFNGSIEIKEKE